MEGIEPHSTGVHLNVAADIDCPMRQRFPPAACLICDSADLGPRLQRYENLTPRSRQIAAASCKLYYSLANGSNFLFQAGSLAQKRLARGLKLNLTEATALIASVLQERIRDGDHSVAELMQHGKTLLGRRHVLPGVMHQLHEIQVEGTFPDGSAARCLLRDPVILSLLVYSS